MKTPFFTYILYRKKYTLENLSDLNNLLCKYINNSCSPEELNYLLDSFNAGKNEKLLKKLILEHIEFFEPAENANTGDMDEILAKVKTEIGRQQHKKVISFYNNTWFRVAAAVIVVVGISLILFQKNSKISIPANTQNTGIVIASAKDNALLTLEDGTTIMLDSVRNGIINEQEGVQIVKSNGLITYINKKNSPGLRVPYHTITTSKGNKYQLQLADGTKVWLNAGSSITYPIVFTEKERSVSLTGEGFFDVAHNKAKPFVARIASVTGRSRGEIKVLGTRFNLTNYDDEKEVRAVLIEGAIKFVENNRHGHLIKPGEQIVLDKVTFKVKVSKANTAKITAWKDELFRFEGDNIETIMQQVSRWYNVEVIYNGETGNETFSGIISRATNITHVLEILETGGFKFKQEGRKITVTR